MIVSCAACAEDFEAQRSTAKYCSPTCRTRGNRRTPKPNADVPSDLVKVTTEALMRLSKLDTVQGQQVLVIARRMVSAAETGSAVASLSVEHSRLMSLLSRGEKREADPVQAAKDEVARKRAQRDAG